MPQIFHSSMMVVSRASMVVLLLVLGIIAWAASGIYKAGYTTGVGVPVEQPVPFSHEHHVNGLGISCEYCHVSVREASFAGIPPTNTCMTCHSQIWNTSPMLAPVRASASTQRPLSWVRVHDLPDFTYFNHSIHVNKGIGCETCHGQVDKMPLTWRVNTLFMSWCLDCHRNPQPNLRPAEEIFTMNWDPADAKPGNELAADYGIKVKQLSDCSICHR